MANCFFIEFWHRILTTYQPDVQLVAGYLPFYTQIRSYLPLNCLLVGR